MLALIMDKMLTRRIIHHRRLLEIKAIVEVEELQDQDKRLLLMEIQVT
jgi:hypothetical protein